MSRLTELSYRIDERTPLYPGTPTLEVSEVKKTGKGDSCNTYCVKLSNHSGTHVDAPRHFTDRGKTIGEYGSADLDFKRPHIIDCYKDPDSVIGINDLKGLSSFAGFDALVIRTGFGKYRAGSPEIYSSRNPCLAPEAAEWLRKTFPSMRMLGIDAISISSKANRKLGAKAHIALLGDGGRNDGPVLIVEDMRIPDDLKNLTRVIIFPVFGAVMDSSPCVVVGVVDD